MVLGVHLRTTSSPEAFLAIYRVVSFILAWVERRKGFQIRMEVSVRPKESGGFFHVGDVEIERIALPALPRRIFEAKNFVSDFDHRRSAFV